LGEEHPFTLCARASVATNAYLAGDHATATRLSDQTLERSRRVRGSNHPYTLSCAVNHAIDLRATGQRESADRLAAQAIQGLSRVFGPDHPETVAAREGRRAECDIEPPSV
jgi:hypothetical protein